MMLDTPGTYSSLQLDAAAERKDRPVVSAEGADDGPYAGELPRCHSLARSRAAGDGGCRCSLASLVAATATAAAAAAAATAADAQPSPNTEQDGGTTSEAGGANDHDEKELARGRRTLKPHPPGLSNESEPPTKCTAAATSAKARPRRRLVASTCDGKIIQVRR